jgi:hypothetical protein
MKDSGLSKPRLYDPAQYYLHHQVELFEVANCGRCPAKYRGACWNAFWQVLACMASRSAPEGSADYEDLYETYKEVHKAERESLEFRRTMSYRRASTQPRQEDDADAVPVSGAEEGWEYTPF